MAMITFLRIIQAGLRNFLRNSWLSTAATAIMLVTLTIILTSYVATLALQATVKTLVSNINVTAYYKDSTTRDQIIVVENQLRSLPQVEEVRYVSKAEALANYRRQYKNDKSLLDAVSDAENPLPQSLSIKAKDPSKLDGIVQTLNADANKGLLIDKQAISYSDERKKAIDRIVGWSNFLRVSGLVLSALFGAISILIIFNTIRMAIFTRREEIEIMKLVGATPWFIRGPFIVEAAMYGVIAALVAVLLCYGIVTAGAPRLSGYLSVDPVLALFRDSLMPMLLIEMAIGVAVGTFSSLLAMSRYLKLS